VRENVRLLELGSPQEAGKQPMAVVGLGMEKVDVFSHSYYQRRLTIGRATVSRFGKQAEQAKIRQTD